MLVATRKKINVFKNSCGSASNITIEITRSAAIVIVFTVSNVIGKNMFVEKSSVFVIVKLLLKFFLASSFSCGRKLVHSLHYFLKKYVSFVSRNHTYINVVL